MYVSKWWNESSGVPQFRKLSVRLTMATTPASPIAAAPRVTGKIIDMVTKVSVDATRPLPLVCALYAVENPDGVWLCGYYGANRSVFDFLPQKDAEIDEAKLGIAFRHKRLIPKGEYQPALWEDFKKQQFMAYGAHGE
jgi:hypothetical protein